MNIEDNPETVCSSKLHIPVLAAEVLELLVPAKGRVKILDGTIGFGGHSSLILKKNSEAILLGIDRDSEALSYAEKALSFAGQRVHLVKDKFSNLAERAIENGWLSVDALLLDVGVSSPQIDSPERGFSLRLDGPLDMRMDCESKITASQILNTASEEELEFLFREYGGIKMPRKLAKALIARRREAPWHGTAEFANFCNSVLGAQRRPGLQAATLCFQALRIAVNDEINELKKALTASVKILAPGGKIGVISFNSLEDGTVKRFFKRESMDCICPADLFNCVCGHKKTLNILTKKPIKPTEKEIKNNPRASSAKLRVAQKIF